MIIILPKPFFSCLDGTCDTKFDMDVDRTRHHRDKQQVEEHAERQGVNGSGN